MADNSPRTPFAAEVPDRYDTQVLSIPLVKDLQSISEKLRELTHFQLRTYIMFRLAICIYVALTCVGVVQAQENKSPDSISTQLEKQQYDLSTGGKAFLLDEARKASFFLLGELHGENEIPALLRELWPQMWRNGYRNIAAEVSPWAAHQLEFAPVNGEFKIQGLWSKDEAQFVHSFSDKRHPVLWGCDMDEAQPHLLFRDLAAGNPSNPALRQMVEATKAGYNRAAAPELLKLAQSATRIKDQTINDSSLYENVVATLEIEVDRLDQARLSASLRRESLMKNLFLLHYKNNGRMGLRSRVLFRFGRNHLHRGYDRRGVSTLGNFVAEFALAHHMRSFHVAAFAAGGKGFLAGETFDADERQDDPAFELLALVARYPATVFDLRPLRSILHQIPDKDRSSVQKSLVYWADSYDAIICYREVTPLESISKTYQ